ncbi:MAG: tRNA(Met) cytidine acetyltransferase TmcA domain-containing protein, partial [Myxococcota bacterium]
MTRHRRCVVLRGPPDETRARAAALAGFVGVVEALVAADPERVLWIGPDRALGDVPFGAVRRRLGTDCDAVIVDLHADLDADVLGQAHGLVRGGGVLILRLPSPGARPPAPDRLAVEPYTRADVGSRFWTRIEAAIPAIDAGPDPAPIAPTGPPADTREQDALVVRLTDAFLGTDPVVVAITADRGRGKSVALG